MPKVIRIVILSSKPVIAYTMQRFQQHPEIDNIVLVCVHGFEGQLQSIVDKNGITKVTNIVAGGQDYEHSIINGVKSLTNLADDDVVMIHWAASPFVTDEIITENIRVCKEKGNAMSACSAYLLYGTNDGEFSKQVLDRDTFKVLSAPQSFLYKNIVDIYKRVEIEHIFDIVEPHTTSIMAQFGIPIYFSKGNQSNIKITTKDDLELFKAYISGKNE